MLKTALDPLEMLPEKVYNVDRMALQIRCIVI